MFCCLGRNFTASLGLCPSRRTRPSNAIATAAALQLAEEVYAIYHCYRRRSRHHFRQKAQLHDQRPSTPPADTISRPSSDVGSPTELAVSGNDDRVSASA